MEALSQEVEFKSVVEYSIIKTITIKTIIEIISQLIMCSKYINIEIKYKNKI